MKKSSLPRKKITVPMTKNDHLISPEIIATHNDYLVINKPAGLAVHGGGNLREKTLADWLLANYPELSTVGEDSARPGIVHRLDKEVSGLMVVAKNNNSFFSLKDQFKQRSVIKEYLALVHGRIENDQGVINFSIVRSRDGYRMAALPAGTENLLSRHQPRQRDQGNIDAWFKARPAETEFSVLTRFINYTLLRVQIKTGRTHQIRVHFFALGHPLVGDQLYGSKTFQAKNQKINLGRIWLLADRLSFSDLKGGRQSFSLPIPSDLLFFHPDKKSLPEKIDSGFDL